MGTATISSHATLGRLAAANVTHRSDDQATPRGNASSIGLHIPIFHVPAASAEEAVVNAFALRRHP